MVGKTQQNKQKERLGGLPSTASLALSRDQQRLLESAELCLGCGLPVVGNPEGSPTTPFTLGPDLISRQARSAEGSHTGCR